MPTAAKLCDNKGEVAKMESKQQKQYPLCEIATYDIGDVIVFTCNLPIWGDFASMELNIFRDKFDKPCDNIGIKTTGVTQGQDGNSFDLKFQCRDFSNKNCLFKRNVDVRRHKYKLTGTIEFK